jgi:hypothetical protein
LTGAPLRVLNGVRKKFVREYFCAMKKHLCYYAARSSFKNHKSQTATAPAYSAHSTANGQFHQQAVKRHF